MATTKSVRKPAVRPIAKKAAAKKKAAPVEAAHPGRFPFPFFGQGHAAYYEWFEMWIWFEAPVPVAARKKVLAAAPTLCARGAEWLSPTLLSPSTGDQWIHRHLVAEYGTLSAKKRMNAAIALEDAGEEPDDEDDLLAQGKETERFNADIERWLLALHATHPILLVARREDGEAGGTRLGPWHADSVRRFAEKILPEFEALARAGLGADDGRREAISIVVDFVGKKNVDPRIRKLAVTD